MIANPHQIQRLRFTPGQDLLARDFRDGETFEAHLRHWHNRAIHQVYGVNFGLHAEPDYESFVVKVDPGLAYDAKGREIALTTAKTIAIPRIERPHLLVLRHGGNLTWIPEERLQTCDSVPLARTTDRFLDPFHPPASRPLARPRIGYGSTKPGGTAWQAESLATQNPIVSLSLQMDTRAAGFTRPPCYFSWLQGQFLYPPPEFLFQAEDELPALLYPSIEDANLSGFRLRVLVSSFFHIPDDKARQLILARARQNLSVCWMGIQPDRETKSSSEAQNGNP